MCYYIIIRTLLSPASLPLLSAHRCGSDGTHAPNSLQAARAIISEGIDLVEFDVRVSRDREFVVLHDERIAINGSAQPIKDLPAATIAQYAHSSCTLREMLMTIQGRAMAHVDLKDPSYEIEIADLCEAILGRDGFIITTLEDESVARLRRERPHIQTALSLGRSVRGMPIHKALRVRYSELFPARRIAACQPTALALHHKIAHPTLLRWAAKRQLPVLLWTVNTPRQIRKAWSSEYIWAFTTDYPRQAKHMHTQLKLPYSDSVREQA